ncbi:26S proteasome regulatory subunit 7 [Podila epicladia]|nr:26S proteasome regulatory subunit 7 [Podila epicladia]KAG0100120.1 26S proteasome regulatory subunit 7 [Podila epicladia]
MTTRALAMVHLPPMHGTRGVSGYLTRFHRLPDKNTSGLIGSGTWATRTFPGTYTLKRSLFGAPTTSRTSTVPLSSNASRLSLNNGHFNPIKGAGSVILTRGAHQVFAQREVDDVVSFYDDKVTQYASQDVQTVTLKTLLGFGRTTDDQDAITTHNQPYDLEMNLEVARYARKELPVRLARRVKSIQRLPFIVGTNPYIKRVYKLYYDSFQAITSCGDEIRSKEDLDRFAAVLQGLVESHADVIPMLSQGFLECKKYMNKPDIKTFLDEMIRSRIGIRLIAEQVISLREQGTKADLDDDHKENTLDISATPASEASEENEAPTRDVVGVVHRELKPAELIRTCASFVQELCDVNYGSSPEVVINGQTDTTFTYVPVHLEYILCELLKNAVRATVEQSAKMGRSALNPHGDLGDSGNEDPGNQQNHQEQRQAEEHVSNNNRSSGEKGIHAVAMVKDDLEQDETRRPNEFGHPPVEVTIAQGEREITIRIRDQGGGISREDFDVIFDYSFTTVKKENESSLHEDAGGEGQGVDSIFKGVSRLAMQAGLGGPIAGLGFGLPLTRIYAQYFGGNMHLISLQGYGCDVFLKLKQIDESLDDLQI